MITHSLVKIGHEKYVNILISSNISVNKKKKQKLSKILTISCIPTKLNLFCGVKKNDAFIIKFGTVMSFEYCLRCKTHCSLVH